MSNQLAGKKVLFITSNTGIERDELVKPLETLKETLIKATRPGFFVHEAATPKFASS